MLPPNGSVDQLTLRQLISDLCRPHEVAYAIFPVWLPRL